MEIIRIENLNFRYNDKSENILTDFNLTVNSGEMLLICGASGCGKTSLIRHMKKEIMPNGIRSGEVRVNIASDKIAYLFQNPESQIVCDKVEDELTFAAENLNMPREEIGRNLSEISTFFGLEALLNKKTHSLSGGEMQLVNLSAVLMMRPELLILDEPTSQLDPVKRADFLGMLKRIHEESNITIIIVEHNLENLLELADRVLYIDAGKVGHDGCPGDFVKKIYETGSEYSLSMPAGVNSFINDLKSSGLLHRLEASYPLSTRECLNLARTFTDEETETLLRLREAGDGCVRTVSEDAASDNAVSEDAVDYNTAMGSNWQILIKNVYFRYEKKSGDVLKDININLSGNKVYGLIGGNGAGKSSLLSLINGYRKPYRGKVMVKGSVAYLSQNPAYIFYEDNLRRDLLSVASEEKISEIMSEYDFLSDTEKMLDMNPMDLSQGQMQFAAFMKILLTDPDIILMDEPAKGLDGLAKKKLAKAILKLKEKGKMLVIVSHDLNFIEELADECITIYNGEIVSVDTVNATLSKNRFYTSENVRLRRGYELLINS